jgi:serine/threonine-protein kinase
VNDKSILLRLSEDGHDAPRVRLAGSATPDPTTSGERYQIVGEIARGGVGVVYKGRDSDLGRDVAMKLLRDDHLDKPELIQRFVEEAQIGGQLQHPGIVPVYELGMKEGRRPYFAMKLVKGRTLTELLGERGDATNRRALLAHFAQVCQTVAYAHSRGVIHRDLKPANIMVGGFGEVQVVDWGFAKVLQRGGVADERRAKRNVTVVATVRSAVEGSASVAGSVMGTPAYMPPEQALGQVDDLTERADVFSLGAILCEILTGQPPYTEDVVAAATHARLEDAHARLDACGADPDLIALGKACLSALPKDRPRSARDVADVVSAHLSEAESRAHQAKLRAAETEARSEEQRRARKHTIGVAAAILAVVLLGGAAWFTIERTGDRRERRRIGAYDAAMLEATRLDAAQDWPGARSAAEQALGLSTDDSVRRTEAEALRTRIQVHADAAEDAREKAGREAALLLKLDEIALQRANDFDARRTIAAYAAALPDFAAFDGFDRKEELGQHFDTWAWLQRGLHADSDWRSLDKMARTLDPDPWRNQVREAAAGNDLARLQELAADSDATDQSARSLHRLATALVAGGDSEAAIALLRRAYERYPDDFWINYQLAYYLSLRGPGEPREEAVGHALAAVAVRPKAVEIRNFLTSLLGKKAGDAGLDGFDYATELRETIRLDPDNVWAHANLGSALAREDVDGAIAEFRKVIRLAPNFVGVRLKLGLLLLHKKRDLDGAIEQFREVVRLDPGNGVVHSRLALALQNKRDYDGAIAAVRDAIRLDPDNALHRWLLATALQSKGDFQGAADACRKAAALRPGDPRLRRALADAERMVAVQARLPAVLRGEDQPETADEWKALAAVAQKVEGNAAAARIWRQAFEASPTLAVGLTGDRYNAACAAALAGTAEWRSQARAWLRAELALRAEQVNGKPFPGTQPAAKALRHWLEDPDLTSIREEAALAKLPEAEREALRALWRDVLALLEKASK